MWNNKYIQIFSIAFIIVIVQLVKLELTITSIGENFSYSVGGGIMTIIAMLIPISVVIVVAYKGFYQFWNDLKLGQSR